VEVEIFRFVGNLMDTGESGTDGEVYVTQKGVLCRMKTNGDCARVAGAYLKVDVADRGVEGTGVGVGDVLVRWRDDSPGCGRRMVGETG
jgi:hypothetical protein